METLHDGSGRRILSCRAILFDLDGVLVDSQAVVERTWQLWAARHGLDVPDLVRGRAHGRRAVDTVREVAPGLDAEAEVSWLETVERADTDGLVALPGALIALSVLPDTHRAVVTSGGRALAQLRLTFTGLPLPFVFITAEDVRAGKPDPDGYLRAAERLAVDPAQCVVIEDTPAGIAAGRAAGAIVLALTTTFPASAVQDADLVAPSLAAVHIDVSSERVQLAVATVGPGPGRA